VLKNTAMLRFYYPNINVDKLTDNQFCKLASEMFFVLKFNGTLQDKNE
jgi:hypothetical protein